MPKNRDGGGSTAPTPAPVRSIPSPQASAPPAPGAWAPNEGAAGQAGQGGSSNTQFYMRGGGKDGNNSGSYIGSTWVPSNTNFFVKSAAMAKKGFLTLPGFERDVLDTNYHMFGFKSAKTFWNALVDNAQSQQANGNTYMSPWDVLNSLTFGQNSAGYNALDPSLIKAANGNMSGYKTTRSRRGGGGGGGGPFSQTQTSVNLTDATTAHGLADQALSQFLGRAATPAETENFKKLLNTDESKHPTTTTTTGVSSGSSSTSSSKTTGGTSSSQDAIDFAKSRPDYAEYQYATTFGDAFNQALGSPVSGT